MGSGRFDNDSYQRSTQDRRTRGQDDFHYSHTATNETPVHPTLNPKRILGKPFHKLESRDSAEHPESIGVFVSFDVTGSNISRAREAQQKLPNLFQMLTHYLQDPQLLFAANDDIEAVGDKSIQIGEFESDNRCDEQLRNILLTSNGGGNDGESYDLIMWAAAYRTILDCHEKRDRKGYFFMYCDEPIRTHVEPTSLQHIFGEGAETRIPITRVIQDLKNLYHTFVIWPMGGFDHARTQYQALFGPECVVTLQQPALICELIGSLIGMTENRLNPDAIPDELLRFGVAAADARLVQQSIRQIRVA